MNLHTISPDINYVQAKDDHSVEIEYVTGERKRFDVKPLLDVGKFSQLRNRDLFMSVRVTFDTISWSNNLDIDPEFLYEKSTPLFKEVTHVTHH